MKRFRPLAGLLLALIVAVASLGLAVARVQPPMAEWTWVDLCGDGAAEVAVDAQGQPVGMIHLCPDCIAAFAFASLPLPAAPPLPPQTAGRVTSPAVLLSVALRPAPEQDARGPPVLI